MADRKAIQLALRAPLLALGSLPATVYWDNVGNGTPPATGTEYLEESFSVDTSRTISMPALGGSAEDTGLYVLRWNAQPGDGLTTLADAATAVLALYKPGTGFVVSTGVVVRVRTDVGPTSGAISRDVVPGWASITITIPWRVSYTNT